MSSLLSGIEFTLNQLLRSAMGLRLELLAKGKTPKPGDVKTAAFYDKLRAIGDGVALALRNLKSAEHSQLLRADKLPEVPRDARYSERQSIDSQLQNIRRVQAVATQLCAEVRGIYGLAMTPTMADIIEGVNKVLMEVGKTVDRAQLQATVQKLSSGPSLISATPAADAAASAADLLTQVWLLLSCVVAMTRSRKHS